MAQLFSVSALVAWLLSSVGQQWWGERIDESIIWPGSL